MTIDAVTAEAMKVIEAAAESWDLPLEYEVQPWSAEHYLETGETLPEGRYRSNFGLCSCK